MALLPQAEGAVMSFLGGGGFFIEQLHQSSPPPEVHSELVEKIAVHKRVLVGHWGEETVDEGCLATKHCSQETPANRRKSLEKGFSSTDVPGACSPHMVPDSFHMSCILKIC